MTPHRVLLVVLLGLAPGVPAFAQANPATPLGPRGVFATVEGTVSDLARRADGALLFCTVEGDVGTFDGDGALQLLADAASAPFTESLRAVAETPAGEVVVCDRQGKIYRVPGGLMPVELIYDDLFMIQDASDMIVDATGNFLIASATPSNGLRGLNQISPAGNRWAYWLVQHEPVALAADPLSGDIWIADEDGPGILRVVDREDPTHPTALVPNTNVLDVESDALDGDIAFDVLGNAYVATGDSVLRYARASGQRGTLAVGLGQVRGIALSDSSPQVWSTTGHSVFVAAGSNPTTIHEFANVRAAADVLAPSVGTVPNRGLQVLFYNGIRVFDLAVDLDGNLLVGGDLFGANFSVRRIRLPVPAGLELVAGAADGLSGRIEGIAPAPDGTLFALTSSGRIHAIEEGATPLVTTVYADQPSLVTAGKDLALARDGTLFIADREGFGPGELLAVSPDGTPVALADTSETRGLAADPFTGQLLLSEWNCTGFCGTVGRYDFDAGAIFDVAGFATMNYSNDAAWGDGDLVVDVEGGIYTVSEDDWRLVRFDPSKARFELLGSSYLNHPSGLAIARSRSGSGSTTGWSLYVSEFDFLWELPGVPPAAPRWVDPEAPPIGTLVGWFSSEVGTPRAMVADPAGGALLVTTSTGVLLSLSIDDGSCDLLANAADGLAGDLVGLAATPAGTLVAVSAEGRVFGLDPGAGYAVTELFADPADRLFEVRGVCVDGNGTIWISARDEGRERGSLWRLAAGVLERVAHTARGQRPAIDPLTAELFLAQRGNPSDGAGEVLRLDVSGAEVAVGNFHGDAGAGGAPTTFELDARDGALAFDAAGDFYVAQGVSGRVQHVDRTSGARTLLAGNYERPEALVVAAGRDGIAGAQGASLFVLDGWSVWEHGLDAGIPGAPPAAPPGLAPAAALRVGGLTRVGDPVAIELESVADAGRVYVVLVSLQGKLPGFPLGSLGNAGDPRVLLNNALSGAFLPSFAALERTAFAGVLDGAGVPLVPPQLVARRYPAWLHLDGFLDLTWVALDAGAPNGIATVGGTTQIYLGPDDE